MAVTSLAAPRIFLLIYDIVTIHSTAIIYGEINIRETQINSLNVGFMSSMHSGQSRQYPANVSDI